VGIHWDTPLNINLNINNENQDYKIDIVYMRGYSGSGEGEGRRLQWWYMVDGLYIPIWNRIKKPLAIALSRVRRGLTGRDNGVNVTKGSESDQNCHYEYPPYNGYILRKNLLKKKKFLKVWGMRRKIEKKQESEKMTYSSYLSSLLSCTKLTPINGSII
jgi:hypothetical protein